MSTPKTTDPLRDDRALAAAAAVLAERAGVRLDAAIQSRLVRCVHEEAAARNLSLTAYVQCLATDARLLQGLLDRVTVQETSFFRDTAQFEALAQHVLPTLTAPVTVWSAASSNGQEPYSIAMALAESACPSWRVVATDVSTRALARTARARYTARELDGMPDERRARFFTKAGRDAQIVDELRSRVDVEHYNLASTAPPPVDFASCQVVFCRNVLIYFSPEQVVAFLDRLASWLQPGSWLFLGYSESLWQITDRFTLVRLGDAFVYRSGHAPTAPGVAAPRVRRVRTSPPELVPALRRAEHRRPRVAPPPIPAPVATANAVGDLLELGTQALATGVTDAAVAAFRRAAFVDPDHPLAHFHLAVALQRTGDRAASARAFAAARAAVARCESASLAADLEGYDVAEFARMLDRRAQVVS